MGFAGISHMNGKCDYAAKIFDLYEKTEKAV
jgi:hypothetical protein